MDHAGIASTSESREGHQPSVPLARLPMREPRNVSNAGSRIGVDQREPGIVVLTYTTPRDFWYSFGVVALGVIAVIVANVTEGWSNLATLGLSLGLAAVIAPFAWWATRQLSRRHDQMAFVTLDVASGELRLPQARVAVPLREVIEWQVVDVPTRLGANGLFPHAQLAMVYRADGQSFRQLVLIGISSRGFMVRLGRLLSERCGCGFQHGVAQIGGVDGRGVFVASGWEDPRLSWPVDQPEHEQFADAPPVDCVKCGYSRAGLSALQVCPECGQI